MSEKILKTRIILRNDTLVNWQSENPVLSTGEIAINTTDSTIKIGNGTEWSSADNLKVKVTKSDITDLSDLEIEESAVVDLTTDLTTLSGWCAENENAAAYISSQVSDLTADIDTLKANDTFLSGKIDALSSGTTFKGLVVKAEGETDIEAINRLYNDGETPKAGDIVLVQESETDLKTAEWICSIIGTEVKWQRFGDPEVTTRIKTYVDNQVTGLSGTVSENYLSVEQLAVSSDALYNSLSVIKITPEEFQQTVIDDYDKMQGNVLYVIDGDDVQPMYGKRITSLGEAVDETDAPTYGQVSAMIESHTFDLQPATADLIGGVKTSNEITLDENNQLSVVKVKLNKIEQSEGDILVLDCGNASQSESMGKTVLSDEKDSSKVFVGDQNIGENVYLEKSKTENN